MLRHQPKAISLDLDDTLWPIWPVIEAAERAVMIWFEEHCPKINETFDIQSLRQLRSEVESTRPEIAHDMGALRLHTLASALAKCGYSRERVTDLASRAYQIFYQHRNQVVLYDEVLSVLADWSRRYSLIAVTNGNADLSVMGLSSLIPHMVSASTVGVAKPDQRVFDAARQQLGLAASDIVHIGDHPVHDVEGARDSGFQVIWLNRRKLSWDRQSKAPAEATCLRTAQELLATLP